jgi:hypothetical protein
MAHTDTSGRLGNGSWPFELGGLNNSRSSKTRVTAEGRVLWSAKLPNADGSSLAIGADGTVYAACGNELAAFGADGKAKWTVSAKAPVRATMVLADGRLVAPEQRRMVIRDGGTGKELAHWSLESPVLPSLTANGHLVYVELARAGARLCVFDLAGNPVWEAQLTGPVFFPPLAQEKEIVVGDGTYVRAFSNNGEILWVASALGFARVTADDRALLLARRDNAEDMVDAPVVAIDRDVYLASFRPASRPPELVLIEAAAGSVRVVKTAQRVTHPSAVARPAGKTPLIVATMPNVENVDLVGLSLRGEPAWRVAGLPAPRTVITDGEGRSLVLCSPTRERFEQYGKAYRLAEQCFVLCVDAEGKQVFRWQAPGPLASPLAIGKAGEVYAMADGKLWAVA